MRHVIKEIAILSVIATFCAASSASAATVAAVEGADSARLIQADNAISASFDISETVTAGSVTAAIDCIGCTGFATLTNSIGSSAGVTNLLDAVALEDLTSTTLFSALTFAPGSYFLTIAVTSGFSVWDAATSPTVVNSAAGSVGDQFSASGLNAFAPASNFGVEFSETSVVFNVSGMFGTPPDGNGGGNGGGGSGNGNTSEVPLPAALPFLLSGLALFGLIGRRRSA